jgi:hypothetical protein
MVTRSMSKRFTRVSARSRWGIAALVAALLAAGGFAYAAVPNSSTGQITVCYPAAGATAGQLRVIDYQAGARCRSTEKMLSWQQSGMRYRGSWKGTVGYSPNDVVVSAGSAYVAIAASANVAPTDTNKWAVFAAKGGPRPSGIVWVAKSGGDFTSVKAALASITNNSVAHRYVIKVAPGTYVEPGGIDLKNYVDLEGSGQESTVITCACGNAQSPMSADGASATLRATGPNLRSEVRQITVANTGPSTYSTAIWTHSLAAGTVTFTGVTARASGGTGDYAVWSQDSSPTLRDMRAISTGNGTTSTESFAVTIAGSHYDYYTGYAMSHVSAQANGAKDNIGVRVTDNVYPMRAIDVESTAGMIDPAGLSTGFYLLNAHLRVNDGTGRSTASFSNGQHSLGALVLGSLSDLRATNSFFGGYDGAFYAGVDSIVVVTSSTFDGGGTGPGKKACSFIIEISSVPLVDCG